MSKVIPVIVAGMTLYCTCDEAGELEVGDEMIRMWAFVTTDPLPMPMEIFCPVSRSPSDLKVGDRVVGTVECVRLADQGQMPAVFLASVSRA
jgi:hypothetical protein